MKRTCVIISPYFPPSTLAGVHRARHLAKHLPAAGWEPIVVAVDETFHEQQLDPGLAALVPASVEILKVRALSARVSRPLGLGEISLRAWRPLHNAVMHLLAKRSVDAVFITGSPYYPMLMASEIKRRFSVPVVLDFQDPWVSAWGAAQSLMSKSGIAHRLAMLLEPRALRAANFVTSVSDKQNEDMAARYPWLDARRMAAIPIGGDPEDFQTLRRNANTDPLRLFKPETKTLSYVGTFMPRTAPLMQVFLRAFARARAEHPKSFANVRLLFVGTSNQPNDRDTYQVQPLARHLAVADVVHEVPQRVGFLDAISVLTRSDGIMLIGSDEPHYTASKIYPGLMAGRPFISLFHRSSTSHSILSAAGGGLVHSFANSDELIALEQRLAESLRTLIDRGSELGLPVPEAYASFEARAIAAQFAAVFDRAREVGS